jgi:hypothetical protein
MPISREEFEQGRIDLALPIARLLAGFPDLAFTAEEVQQMVVEIEGRNSTLVEVEQALGSLVLEGRVQRKEMSGQQWYAIVRKRLGFLRE